MSAKAAKAPKRQARAGAASAAGPAKRAVISGDRWLDDFIPYQLYRVTNKLNARLLNRLRKMRINPSQWRVLSVLRAQGPTSINEIVEATIIAQPTVSRVVARLERAGKVTRRPSARDSRVVEISLTPDGVEAFNQIVPTALRHQELAFRDISPRDVAQLVATLKRIESNIEATE
jgi:MarR family transcriptional regulator, organic hydroperoxide resistance regulator